MKSMPSKLTISEKKHFHLMVFYCVHPKPSIAITLNGEEQLYVQSDTVYNYTNYSTNTNNNNYTSKITLTFPNMNRTYCGSILKLTDNISNKLFSKSMTSIIDISCKFYSIICLIIHMIINFIIHFIIVSYFQFLKR